MKTDLDYQALGEQLRARLEYARSTRTPEVNAFMDLMIEDVRRAGTAAPEVGHLAPDFALPNALGVIVRLSELLKRSAVVIVFYRGGWCPYCNLQLRAYQRVLPELRALGGELVAISPQLPDGSLSTTEKNALTFHVLSDVANAVARTYSLVFTVPPEVVAFYLRDKGVDLTQINGDESWELPIPATFVIGRDGAVAMADVDPDYTRRLEPATVLDTLRCIA